MNTFIKLRISKTSPQLFSALIVLCLQFSPVVALAFQTTAERISANLFFDEHIIQVGPQSSAEDESQLLWDVLESCRASRYQTGVDQLEDYLNIMTNSPWAPSLDATLGKFYYQQGRYTLALEHYELAWAATRFHPVGNGKKVADITLANWTRLLASLGRYETLDALAQETRGRILDRGPLSQKWARTKEAMSEMRWRPGISYKCGTFALNRVSRELRLNYDVRALMDVPSPATGFSIMMLWDLSTQLHLGLVPVFREAGQDLPVPAVVHWRQNHYAAIVSQHGVLYKVVDPTFGHARYDCRNHQCRGQWLLSCACDSNSGELPFDCSG